MKKHVYLSATAVVLGFATFANAAPARAPASGFEAEDQITVTATRTPTTVIDAPATVSVIDDAQIADQMIDDIKDLVRFEPGVSVRTQPSRFTAALSTTGRDSNSGFNIRGLEGNRVLIQTDGIRLPDAFSFGAQSVGRGDYADLDLIKSVEILRGPASALYGSDGLAGAVSFTTKDPGDVLTKGQSFGGQARVGYASADAGWTKGLLLAGQQGQLSGLIAYTRRDSGTPVNQGTNNSANTTRTTPNPQDTDSNAVLAKLVWSPSDAHKLRFSYEHQDRDVTTDVLSARAVPPLANTSTLALTALDQLRRNRYSLDYRYRGTGLITGSSIVAYRQDSRTRQFSSDDRNTALDRTRDNSFDNRVTGASFQVDGGFATGTIKHGITLGGDWSETRQSGVRDGTVPPTGEIFPTRAFPVTDYTLAGLFIQDAIDVGQGTLLLYPALRFDAYRLSPQADPTFPGTPSRQSGSRVSPKLGAIVWATPSLGAFASYAEGFRSPTPSQVNNGFANLIFNYVSLASPNLRPETSRAFEGGLRLRNAEVGGVKLNASLTGFTARYRDFIEQRQVSGSFTAASPAVFQFINVGRVDVDGVEGKVDAEFGGGFGATVAVAYARGRANSGTAVDTPLSSIDPVKLVGGLRYRSSDNRISAQLIVTHSAGKQQTDVSESCSPTCFTPPGFTIVDATMAYTPIPAATVRVGIFNLFDKKYFWWSDVRALSATSTTLDAYSQAGRNASLSLALKF